MKDNHMIRDGLEKQSTESDLGLTCGRLWSFKQEGY